MAKETTKHTDDRLSPGRGYVILYSGVGRYIGPEGMIFIMRSNHSVRMDYAYGGKQYMRSWRHWFGDRTLPRLARQFIQDVQANG